MKVQGKNDDSAQWVFWFKKRTFLVQKTDIFGVRQCQIFQIVGSISDSPGLWGSGNAP